MEDVFCQNFTAGVPGIGETLTVPLKDDGEDIMVTEDNRREFVDLYVDYYLNNAIHKQVRTKYPVARVLCCLVTYELHDALFLAVASLQYLLQEQWTVVVQGSMTVVLRMANISCDACSFAVHN